MTVRQAALIAGIAYLLNPVSYAEFALYPKLVVPHDIAQTVANWIVEVLQPLLPLWLVIMGWRIRLASEPG